MPREVEFHDLPGGPVLVEFSDEISRRSVCTECGRITIPMYTDDNQHIFCRVCAESASAQGHLFCKTENRGIPLESLVEAYEGTRVLGSLKVYCPNKIKGCKDVHTLCTIKEHYMKCPLTTITCKVCKVNFPGVEYETHLQDCASPMVQCHRCYQPVKKNALQHHVCPSSARPPDDVPFGNHRNEYPMRGGNWSSPARPADSSVVYSRVNDPITRNRVDTAPKAEPRQVGLPVQEHRSYGAISSKSTPPDIRETCSSPEEKVMCEMCKKQVKLSNLDKHVQHCENEMVQCNTCKDSLARRCIEEHQARCQRHCAERRPAGVASSSQELEANSKLSIDQSMHPPATGMQSYWSHASPIIPTLSAHQELNAVFPEQDAPPPTNGTLEHQMPQSKKDVAVTVQPSSNDKAHNRTPGKMEPDSRHPEHHLGPAQGGRICAFARHICNLLVTITVQVARLYRNFPWLVRGVYNSTIRIATYTFIWLPVNLLRLSFKLFWLFVFKFPFLVLCLLLCAR